MATQKELSQLLENIWSILSSNNLTIGEISSIILGLQQATNNIKVSAPKKEK